MSGRIALICNPGNRRAAFFRDACVRVGHPEPLILPWINVLRDDFPLHEHLQGACALRIESAGEDFEVERRLICLGSGTSQVENLWPWISAADAGNLEEDPGRVRLQRQWYHGWFSALGIIQSAADVSGVPIMNEPLDIAVAFDKAATQELLHDAGVPIAKNLGICRDFQDLHNRMSEAGLSRVFLKPCHSSSASGVIALETDGRNRWQATTSAVFSGNQHVHNSLRLEKLKDLSQIRERVDAICQERAMAERWIPKASIGGRTYDLRILVIAGQAAHVVVRTSRSPITNLHLGNQRGDADAVRTQLGEAKWLAAMRTAEAAAVCFSRCHYLAVDLMVDSSFRRFVVAEVNAFGDLLPKVLWNGMDTYEAELRAWAQAPPQHLTARSP
ncbi:STM4014 family protein [Luteolibacter yonseiensis]|uniref:STM4014 family protein n=1 Tax=Luteolibacter yonseiensis TaxID=1144680 RepID=A0A934R2S5_9BACT|nr:STM4014 family protein [Luteolibacter yonseiensis]MBK1815038.1 STM4014 family protein [Luteolibacter yonseiensis]